jgi:hypothetical protein
MPYELRTKSIEESIVKDVPMGHSMTVPEHQAPVRVVEYCPGDGTRYELVFTRLGNTVSGARDSMLVTLTSFRGCPSMLVEIDNGFLAPHYVAEKMDIHNASAVTLAEIIAHYTRRDAYTPDEYRAHVEELQG